MRPAERYRFKGAGGRQWACLEGTGTDWMRVGIGFPSGGLAMLFLREGLRVSARNSIFRLARSWLPLMQSLLP